MGAEENKTKTADLPIGFHQAPKGQRRQQQQPEAGRQSQCPRPCRCAGASPREKTWWCARSLVSKAVNSSDVGRENNKREEWTYQGWRWAGEAESVEVEVVVVGEN